MKTLLMMLLGVMLAAMKQIFAPGSGREACWNAEDPNPHDTGRIGKVAESDFGAFHLLAKKGVAAGSCDVCGAADEPLGPCIDQPKTDDRATVQHLGATSGTMTVIASKAIAENTRVYTTAGGKVTDAIVSGSYLVGKTVTTSAADNDPLEIVPCFPVVNP